MKRKGWQRWQDSRIYKWAMKDGPWWDSEMSTRHLRQINADLTAVLAQLYRRTVASLADERSVAFRDWTGP